MTRVLRRIRAASFYAAMLRLPILLLALLLAVPSWAGESNLFRSPRTTASLITDAESVQPGQAVQLGLLLRLASGWHTYWRNAGDAGAPAELNLALPPGASATGIEWPAPHRLPQGPLVSFGYTGEVVLPLTLTVPANIGSGDTLRVEAEGTWLVCADICVPEESRFRLDLPVAESGSVDPAQIGRFVATRSTLPSPSPWPTEVRLERSRARLVLSDPAGTLKTPAQAFFFPDQQGLIENAAAQPFNASPNRLVLDLLRPPEGPTPARLDGVLVLTDQDGRRAAYTIAAPTSAAASSVERPWPLLLLSAFLGGLLLNLMPCVFPVLAMKAMALARLSGASKSHIRGETLSYTIGVLLSMLALASAILILRGTGQTIGWGFQFTSPVFVTSLCWLMLAVGLNLSGVFHLGGAIGFGSGLTARGGYIGSFATGALAVLVATPCTAPFMAVAIGAAFTLPPAATLAIFACLGLGLAMPYTLLGLFPALARALPRPGAWMEQLRQALAFPMYAAAAWLAWVLAQQSGPEGLGLLLAGSVLIGFAAWAIGLTQAGGKAGRWLAGAAIAAACVLLVSLTRTPAQAVPEKGSAEAWSAARVAALQSERRPVFVNLTAAWCITCKLNERLVLGTEAMQSAFARHGVVTLTGDWTRGDPAISALLRAHGREGVPLYLFYPADGGSPQVLPQVLTEGMLLRIILQAS